MDLSKKPKRLPKTIKEKKFVNEYLKTGNATEAAQKVYNAKSYNSSANIGYQNLKKLDFPTILDRAGITDDFIAKTIRGGMKAKNNLGKPEWASRLKATELATKSKGHLKERIEGEINITEIKFTRK